MTKDQATTAVDEALKSALADTIRLIAGQVSATDTPEGLTEVQNHLQRAMKAHFWVREKAVYLIRAGKIDGVS